MNVVHPITFIDKVVKKNEKGQPWQLAPYQRRVLDLAFKRGLKGELLYRLVVLSEPKKSGKTFLAACLGLWWAVTTRATEIIVCANDREQAESRVFKTMVDLIEQNPALKSECKPYSREIVFENGTIITAISSDFKGAAGSRHSLVIYDELWGFELESSRRLYEELTPPPSEFSAWVLIVTYAGFSGESDLLESIYNRGMAGRRIDSELECYDADELFMFWSHTPRQEWQDDAYYAQQANILRPNQFRRLHRNEWVSSENTFIEPASYDSCVESGLKPDSRGALFIGVDASIRRDSTAAVCVRYDDHTDRLVLADYKIWKPAPGQPINLEASVEFYLRRIYGDFPRTEIAKVFVDPYQMARSVQTLQAAGLPVEEYNQTQNNLTEATEALYSVLTTKGIRLYNAPDLREHVLNAVSVETPRGIRLSKQKTSRKIDGAVALSFAVLAAVQNGRPASSIDEPLRKIEVKMDFDPRDSRTWAGRR
jgi:hypothetical protein